jgi:ELWxxDGT repeat protein
MTRRQAGGVVSLLFLASASFLPGTAFADGPRVALIKDINPGGLNSNPGTNVFTFVSKLMNGVLFFPADDGVNGVELWKTDGTASGTVLVKDINPSGPSNPGSFVVFNNTLFFIASDGVTGFELWKSDGTAAGTVLVKDINTGGGWAFSGGSQLAVSSGFLFLPADNGVLGRELWKSDGTAAGTVLVKDLEPGAGSGIGFPQMLDVNGTLFFPGFLAASG